MTTIPTPWRNTTHDWAATVDHAHLTHVRSDQTAFAPGGPDHLVLEVIAYAADEAEHRGSGNCAVTLHPDGSVSVADDGRGTDTRADAHGRPVKKPVMATKDLRFFDNPGAQTLPDGHPRRGMSVVAALSEWLVHTNRWATGSWTQRYEHGVPVTDLIPVTGQGGTATTGTTGTTVRFRPGGQLYGAAFTPAVFERSWPRLTVEVRDLRTG